MEKCRYAAIKDFDMNQSPGISVSLWFQGCEHKCEDCYNKDTWDFNKGKEFTDVTIDAIIKLLKKDGIHKNLSILGGETLSMNKRDSLLRLIKRVKEVDQKIQVWIWTGYLFEDVCDIKVVGMADFIVDGKYVKELHEPTRFKGSSNQRVINVQESLKQNKIVLYY